MSAGGNAKWMSAECGEYSNVKRSLVSSQQTLFVENNFVFDKVS